MQLTGTSDEKSISITIFPKNWPKNLTRTLEIDIPTEADVVLPFGKKIASLTIDNRPASFEKNDRNGWATIMANLMGKPIVMKVTLSNE